jgi:undecaprenyl diphosphate synthase
MAYGGQEEIVDMTKKIAQLVQEGKLDPDNIDADVIRQNLYMAAEPDMIIRTGGERRTSNFLAFQGVYSEYFFLDKHWPEFEKQDFVDCMNQYAKRKRRFGK